VVNASGTYGARAADPGDGWSQPRPVRSGTGGRPGADGQQPGTAGQPLPPELSPRKNGPERRHSAPASNAFGAPAGPSPSPRVVVGRPAPPVGSHPQHAPASALQQARESLASERQAEYGLPGWAALLVLVAIAGAGAVIDTLSGSQARGGFNIGIVAAAVVAILVVRRSAMFPVVVAPPIVYSAVSGMLLYARSNGLHDHKIVIDTAANWLVYGFPAIAAATASVLIIAGIRLLTRR
jgi:hypothetical protein